MANLFYIGPLTDVLDRESVVLALPANAKTINDFCLLSQGLI